MNEAKVAIFKLKLKRRAGLFSPEELRSMEESLPSFMYTLTDIELCDCYLAKARHRNGTMNSEEARMWEQLPGWNWEEVTGDEQLGFESVRGRAQERDYSGTPIDQVINTSVIWKLETDHIEHSDIRGRGTAVVFAAMSYETPSADGVTGVRFERSTDEVLKMKAKAKFWMMPQTFLRPVPLGNGLTKSEMKEILEAPDIDVTPTDVVYGDGGQALDDVKVRYHCNTSDEQDMKSNYNVALLSKRDFPLKCILEFM